jgi:hypothetical protein
VGAGNDPDCQQAIDDIRRTVIGVIDPHPDLAETICNISPAAMNDVVYLEPFD